MARTCFVVFTFGTQFLFCGHMYAHHPRSIASSDLANFCFFQLGPPPNQRHRCATLAAQHVITLHNIMRAPCPMYCPSPCTVCIMLPLCMQGLGQDVLLPPWLASCPNLSTLELDTCTTRCLSDLNHDMPGCGQIQTLKLAWLSTSTDERTSTTEQRQLHALTGLTSLEVDEKTLDALHCCSGWPSQLSSLPKITRLRYTGFERHPLVPVLVAHAPTLQKLELPSTTVDDEALQAILKCPALKWLECNTFELEQSYCHRPCSWTHVGIFEIYVDALGLLPLDGVRSMHIRGRLNPSPDLSSNVRVAEAISRCSVNWCGYESAMFLDSNEHVDHMCLAAVMPIFVACNLTRLCITNARSVTPELLAAMAQHLTSSRLIVLSFVDCTWAPGVWPMVLPNLPPTVTTLKIGGCRSYLTEELITDMCVHACRPVRVCVQPCMEWAEGSKQRVQAAMAQAGHQHVEYIKLSPYYRM